MITEPKIVSLLHINIHIQLLIISTSLWITVLDWETRKVWQESQQIQTQQVIYSVSTYHILTQWSISRLARMD